MIPVSVATEDQIRELARDILARPAYARWRTLQAGWLRKVLAQLGQWLQSWLEWMHALSVSQPVLYALVVFALLLTAAALVGHLVYALRVALAAGRVSPTPARATDAPNFVAAAEALAGSGQFLEAARHLQLAVIDLLLRRRTFELRRSDPNRILRARVHAAALPAGERTELLALVDRLETRWFRDRAEDRDLYDAWRRLHARLHALPEHP